MMVMTEEKDKPQDARTRRALIEVVTENGISIVRSCDGDESAQGGAFEYRFIVSHPEGLVREVVVEFDLVAVVVIQRKRRIRHAHNSSFWIACAGRPLAEYL